MFDKFTERARRVIFFARHEASQFGCPQIETELLLLGIFREYPRVFEDLGGNAELTQGVESETRSKIAPGEKIPTNVDMPLSDGSRRVLQHAVDEMVRLNHPKVSVHHLMVAILHEENSSAAQILLKSGLDLSNARERLVQLGLPEEPYAPPPDIKGDPW
jgi:ATP-dependent Clp protease ATP-binding subunit ClpC